MLFFKGSVPGQDEQLVQVVVGGGLARGQVNILHRVSHFHSRLSCGLSWQLGLRTPSLITKHQSISHPFRSMLASRASVAACYTQLRTAIEFCRSAASFSDHYIAYTLMPAT